MRKLIFRHMSVVMLKTIVEVFFPLQHSYGISCDQANDVTNLGIKLSQRIEPTLNSIQTFEVLNLCISFSSQVVVCQETKLLFVERTSLHKQLFHRFFDFSADSCLRLTTQIHPASKLTEPNTFFLVPSYQWQRHLDNQLS